MYCPRCKVKMVERRRSYHKKRKWTCPRCGRSRMQQAKPRKGERQEREKR